MKFKKEKLEELIKEELSVIFYRELQEPAIKMVTITSVRMTHDMKIAKVYFSVLEANRRKKVLDHFNKLNKTIRYLLAQKIKGIKYIPELAFYIDDTSDQVDKIEKLLNQIKLEEQSRENIQEQ